MTTGLVVAGVALLIVTVVVIGGAVAFYNGKGPSSCRARRLLKRKVARLTSAISPDANYHCHVDHATLKKVCHTHPWKRRHRHESIEGRVLEANQVSGEVNADVGVTLPM